MGQSVARRKRGSRKLRITDREGAIVFCSGSGCCAEHISPPIGDGSRKTRGQFRVFVPNVFSLSRIRGQIEQRTVVGKAVLLSAHTNLAVLMGKDFSLRPMVDRAEKQWRK